MWVKFTDEDTGTAGINVDFTDTPSYNVGHCGTRTDFTLPGTENYRIWTFKKQDNTLQLLCNGVEIFNINYVASPKEACKSQWSQDFSIIRFVNSNDKPDTASDSYRQYADGKLYIIRSHLNYIKFVGVTNLNS